ncbi:NAD(P)H-hydrate dehydratase [Niabella insulamsoli]|uniref:NAD(P)H-hydrate dehydratase n=1 Tax=Niabella insulamsoli TaxID=3144874 RepID=UPI0031FCB60E
MKLLNASQIKAWDQFTINHEPIASIDLMERAAKACVDWITRHYPNQHFTICCGAGNNGGDGLAIARLLAASGIPVTVFLSTVNKNCSKDFNINLSRLESIDNVFIKKIDDRLLPPLEPKSVIIDALFGTGLSRPVSNSDEFLIRQINEQTADIISIDLPSGMFADKSSRGFTVIRATHTLSFQCLKIAFLLPENESYCGQLHLLDIGLHPGFPEHIETPYQLINSQFAGRITKLRPTFSHKGNFGHALLVAGSFGKMGAAVLCTKACLRSGAGLVSVHVPAKGVDIMQISAPEAMCQVDANSDVITSINYALGSYATVGIGPGIGQNEATKQLLPQLFKQFQKPMVIDADALNILSQHPDWLSNVPRHSILTPHPKEFERLFGHQADDFQKIKTALSKAKEFELVIVLKGHYTFIAAPNGQGFFNTTGNAGMAKGGSGDVLTGLIAGLLAQGYESEEAAALGVYWHGVAGDKAAAIHGMTAMTAGHIIEAMKNPAY